MSLSFSSRVARAVLAGVASIVFAITPALAATPDKDPSPPHIETKAAKAREKTGAGKISAKPATKSDKKKTEKKTEKKKTPAKSDPKGAAAKGDKKQKPVAKKADTKLKTKKGEKKPATKKVEKKTEKKSGAKKDAAKGEEPGGAIKGPASIGAPNRGKLSGAIKLHKSKGLKLRDRAQAWGTPDLVKLLQRAAGKVRKKYPKSVMLVGDLSKKSGGPLTGHNSHQSGRDADVGFYVANSKGKPAAMTRFVAFEGDGSSEKVSWAQFDDARNWALVEALLTDKDTTVRYIFVSNPLRTRMLAYAKKQKVAKDLYTKAAYAMLSPRDADVHDDHFHVRISCPEAMKSVCVEESIGRTTTVASDKDDDEKGAAASDAKAAAKGDPKTTAKSGAKAGDAKSDAKGDGKAGAKSAAKAGDDPYAGAP
ncbi:MAG: penicillin-insensitive murein endopeptidase [Polyangiaceae bacterium]